MAIEPSSLKIVFYPDPVLRRRAQEIREFSPRLGEIVERMVFLMREARGIGLAAPQVGLGIRLFIADVPASEGGEGPAGTMTSTNGVEVYINPVLSHPRGEVTLSDEGCLSLPCIRGEVPRPPMVRMTAQGLDGTPFTREGAGLLARCWQHECDHLDGVLILDRFTAESKMKNRPFAKALERAYKPGRGGRSA
ncbi:MAG: peptide deformylase [Phycisphaeraceae bacterium]|nr:peptide deformylase [Phycisphaeraceae bacterium]MCW5753379.1 peptide deformylase [Phycisphaeraceae bacterium]